MATTGDDSREPPATTVTARTTHIARRHRTHPRQREILGGVVHSRFAASVAALVAMGLGLAACGPAEPRSAPEPRPVAVNRAAEPTTTGSQATPPAARPATVPPTVPPTEPPSAAPPTLPSPTAAEPLRVLLLGDGIMWDASPAVQAALGAIGPVVVRDESYWGFGLTRPEWRDWTTLWPQYVAELDPDVVIVTVGPHDVVSRPVDGTARGPGDPIWSNWYGGLLDQAAGALTARGASVVWLGMLWQGQPELHGSDAAVAALNAELAALAERHDAVTYVDAAGALAGPDGRHLELAEPGVRLRKPDGKHLCAEGAERFAAAALRPIAEQLGLEPEPTWTEGAWRADDRYAWDGGEGCRSATDPDPRPR